MSNPDATLVQVTSRVLEELCFHFAEPSPPDSAPAQPVCASVHFHGPWSGKMVVAVEKRLLGELAANLLGDDVASELDEAQALLELTNVICGNALPEIESREAAFVLDAPELGRRSLLPAAPSPGTVASAALDEGKVVVRITREVSS